MPKPKRCPEGADFLDEKELAGIVQRINAKKDAVSTTSSDYFPDIYREDAIRFGASQTRMTGFRNLDEKQPFMPGFYALGAVSSLGKTTFAFQLACQVAASGTPVLYFSLEQTRSELFAKAVARTFYQESRRRRLESASQTVFPAPGNRAVRNGAALRDWPEETEQVLQTVRRELGGNLTVIDGAFSVDSGFVDDYVTAVCNTGARPVVIIDYLQLVEPARTGVQVQDYRTGMDRTIHNLKSLQQRFDLSLLVLSSLNRANYGRAIDFESFKETGSIEYTCDVVWGMQLSVLRSKDWLEADQDGRRAVILARKAESPRHIDLVCLKNRFGPIGWYLDFDYYPEHDTFYPSWHRDDPLSVY